MVFDLHIWGSAFGLPSIDPECLAIITYLHNASPSPSWRIVPSNDPAISPANLFPALNHDGIWTSGFKAIVLYLNSQSLCQNLDESLKPSQKADNIAYTAYISTKLAPLLDLSLYVSAANWSATTRPAYSKLLTFPLTWTVPPLVRAQAVRRCEHLGMADLDTDFDPNGGLHLSTGRDALPETFRKHLPVGTKRTVKEEMTPEQAAAIRLFGMTEDCLSVLEEVLKPEEQKGRFLRPQMSSLDCLAFGYLAIMRDAPVPRSFLRDWIQEKAPRLSMFIDDIKFFHMEDLQAADVEQTTALRIGVRALDSCILNIPDLGHRYAEDKRIRAEQGTTGFFDGRAFLLAMSVIGTVALGLARSYYAALGPYGVRTQVWRRVHERSKLSQYGDLGGMLQSLGPVLDSSSRRNASDGRIVQTDSEVD